MSASAEWVSVTGYVYDVNNSLTTYYMQFNRRPGVYLNKFDITAGIYVPANVASGTYRGIYTVPYDRVPALNNSTRVIDMGNQVGGTTRTKSLSVASGAYVCITFIGSTDLVATNIKPDYNYKYFYAVYPNGGSVTASNASGSMLGGAKTVTFATPTACSWPSPYSGTWGGHNNVQYGLLWPDVLISYSTFGTPADPTYPSNNGIFTYAATGSANGNKTTASLNLAANQTYTVKVRLAVDNGGDRRDVEYGTVNTFMYDTYEPPAASLPSGTYYNTQKTALTSPGGCDMYYTLDGSAPSSENGIKYTEPIQITENTKIRVRQYCSDTAVGAVTDFNYTINIPGVTANPSPWAVGQGTKITLSPSAGDAANNDLYYTETDTLPYDKWTPYTTPLEITEDTTLYAIARDKISGRYGEKATFTYQYSELGYILNDLSFWDGSTKVTSTDISTLAGKTVMAKANITKIIPSVQGWLVTALYNPSGRAQQIKLDKLDQLSGIATGDAVGKSITLPSDTTNYVLKTFIVYDFVQLRPMGNIVQIGEREE